MKVESVVIVGTGSSGWMTAALLSKMCPHLEIAIVEDPDGKPVGVGESTLGHFNLFLKLLDLKDEDWMPACNATYKNSIRFTNFREGKGEKFEYPFTTDWDYRFAPNGINSWSHFALLDPENFPPETFAQMFSDNTFLAEYNRQTRNEDNRLRSFRFDYDTAYHLDADLFGQYLKDNIAIPNGVKVLKGKVTGFQKESVSDPSIRYIILDYESAVFADLYIDCTGFNSMLLEGYMGQEYMSYDKKLANDSAWACRIPYENREEEMHNVTDCHAMKNGWAWNIPLWNRIGTGYCYSSRFCTKEEAKEEFIEHLGERGKEAELFHIDIKHGRRRTAWFKNVVGIGLSYGFLEPLESTGLLTTHENAIWLASVLSQRDGRVTSTDIAGYNYTVEYTIDSFSDFIAMHYAYSMRDDTPYWRYVTNICEYLPEAKSPHTPKHKTLIDWQTDTIAGRNWHQNMNGMVYIAAGMGYKSTASKDLMDADWHHKQWEEGWMDQVKDEFLQYKKDMIEYVKSLPTHYEFLRDEIYKTK